MTRPPEVIVIADDPDTDVGALARFIDDIARFDALARAALRADADDPDGEVRGYREHHEVEHGIGDPTLDDDRFIAGLILDCVGLHPDPPEPAAVFDYTIDPGKTRTQYVLCVRFTIDGEVAEIAMES